MKEFVQQRLSDNPTYRWLALIIVSFTMMCGYFLTDVMSPLQSLLTGDLGWSDTEYGFFSGAYGYINVFLLMLFFGGIILDKMGVRFTGVMSASLMIIGAFVKWYAVSRGFEGSINFFGTELSTQVAIASLGFAIFGVGAEITGITVSKIVVKWFEGKELALAMGLQVALARLGTAAALGVSPIVAKNFSGVQSPIFLGGVLLVVGLVAFFYYCVLDVKEDKTVLALKGEQKEEAAGEDEGFKLSDIGSIVSNSGFWLIALLCLMFYGGVFPFLKFATNLMINKYHVDPELAGFIPAVLPFGTIFLTPIFGSIYDRIGRGATLMLIGSGMLTLVHVCFTLPLMNFWWFALVMMIVLGIAFSLVPSAMWPSVPKIIPMKQLGTAFSLIFFIQNIGLSMIPLLIGSVIDNYAKTTNEAGDVIYNYSYPMAVFTLFGGIAICLSLILLWDNKRKGYGLEDPNVKKEEA